MDNTKPLYTGLYKTPVFYVDDSETSPDLFQIKEFPTQFNAGKNIFKLRGHYKNLRENSGLYIEILDYENEPIYFEIADSVDEDGSLSIVVYIDQTTPNGSCTVTVLGEAIIVDSLLVPLEWQRRNNIMWQRTVLVNSSKTNTADITFDKKPTITIQEQVSVQLDRKYDTTQTIIYNSGSVQFKSSNGAPLLTISNGNFTSDMVGGTVTVNTPINPLPVSKHITGSIPYSSIIERVISTSSILLRSEYLIDPSQSLYGHRYDMFDTSLYSLKYEASPIYLTTENSESYALIEINDLQPVTGDITRIKVFANNSGTIGNWDLLSDVALNDIEIFVTSTSSIEPYEPIGFIKSSSIINTYYESTSYNGFNIVTGPTLLYSNTNLPNSLYINSTRDISARNNIDVVKIKDQYNGKFIKDASYKLNLTAIGNRTIATGNTDPVISFYLSGSAFNSDVTDYFNHELPIKVGKYIGNLHSKNNSKRFDNVTIKFTADKTGTGVLYYLIEGGQWQIADIQLTTNNEPGYTPNYTRIRTKIPTNHKSGVQQSFKIEYYNSRGVKSEFSSISEPIDWVGGNHYIDGDHNLVTGSLFVADKLSTGIEFNGRGDSGMIRTVGYTGFGDKNKGMMIWSGSALSGSSTDYKGTGLELYSSDDNYFRFATDPSETKSLYIKTETFHLGNSSSFISSDGGTITMSGSVVFDAVTVPTASYALTSSYYKETDPIFTAKSGSLATTGSNIFSGSQTINGNLTVIGTASFAYTTASIIEVGSNVIILNTDNPSVRFGGITVIDSGSFGNDSTGSLFWDSQNNRWVYANPSGSTYDGGMLISGPRNTSGLGNEAGVLTNFLTVGQGVDHISSSAIFHSGSITQITGSLLVTNGITGSLFGTASYALTSANTVNISNTNLTITANTTRVLSHAGTSKFIISGSTSTNAALEIESTSTGNSRILVMRQQLNGESTKYAQRSITTGGDSLDSSEFNGWSTDSVFEATGSSTPVPPNKLKGFQWAIFNGTDYILPLNISSSGNIGIGTTSPNSKLDVNGNTIITGSLNNGLGNTIGSYSHAEGINTLANGIYSHAEGQSTTTFGTGSHAEGTGSVASGSYSHAEGWRTITSGSFSHAEGGGTTTRGNYSHAEGGATTAFGSHSHAEGLATITSGSYSHAEGLRSVARGLYSHAEGGGTASEGFGFELDGGTAHGEGSHAEGARTIASGSYSHAEGQDTVAIGQASHAEGRNTLAIAWGSHAEGFFTTASGYISHAEGYNTHSSGSYQHVQGQYNMSSSVQSAFIIGNGTSDAARSNLVFAAGSSFQITGSIDFNIVGSNRHAKIFTGTTPNPNTFGATTLISGYGENGYGLILQSGDGVVTNDIGGIKITDDGVAIWGSGDNDLFRAVNEDSNDLKFVITNNGSVGIGMDTGSTAYQLHLSTDSAAKPSTNTWTISSDIRLKENIIEADYDMCYDIVKNLPLKRYTWKPEAYTNEQVTDRSKLGWIAQDVEALFPKAVATHSFSGVGDFHIDDCRSLNSDQIYAAMYGTIKKLINENDILKSELQTIKTHIGL